MKKVIAVLLSLLMLASLSACGEKTEAPDTDDIISLTDTVSEADINFIPLLCTDNGWQIVEDSTDGGYQYVTFYDFYSDGKCVMGYGYYFSDMLGGGEGTYTVEGDLLNISLMVDDFPEPYESSYRIEQNGNGFTLTQESDSGLFNFHEKGYVMPMEPYTEEDISE